FMLLLSLNYIEVIMLENGYEIIDDFLSEKCIAELKEELALLNIARQQGGIRNIERKSQAIFCLSKSESILHTAQLYLTGQPRLVRAIYFNKTSEQNWSVTWHQDKTVAVTKRFSELNWQAWSMKDQTLHVQPPVEVLNDMITLRIHLDSATVENGCLKVIPGSHKLGILSNEQINKVVSKNHSAICQGRSGSVLLMRPHLLHASGKAIVSGQRRVIHLEYSSYRLPDGVQWAAQA
ncbi:MAG: phytanoyl-CoA dioxygenase family protein, partial [Calditrichota bacterium]